VRALNQNLALPRIVVGVDGSSASLAALRWAVREAGLRGTALHVVRAWEDAAKRVAPYASHAYPPEHGEDLLGARQRLEAGVTAAVGCTSLAGLTVEIAEGLAARVLLDHANGAAPAAPPMASARWPAPACGMRPARSWWSASR
jgi:nucleotide-binding universal stress UspA family protein